MKRVKFKFAILYLYNPKFILFILYFLLVNNVSDINAYINIISSKSFINAKYINYNVLLTNIVGDIYVSLNKNTFKSIQNNSLFYVKDEISIITEKNSYLELLLDFIAHLHIRGNSELVLLKNPNNTDNYILWLKKGIIRIKTNKGEKISITTPHCVAYIGKNNVEAVFKVDKLYTRAALLKGKATVINRFCQIINLAENKEVFSTFCCMSFPYNLQYDIYY